MSEVPEKSESLGYGRAAGSSLGLEQRWRMGRSTAGETPSLSLKALHTCYLEHLEVSNKGSDETICILTALLWRGLEGFLAGTREISYSKTGGWRGTCPELVLPSSGCEERGTSWVFSWRNRGRRQGESPISLYPPILTP